MPINYESMLALGLNVEYANKAEPHLFVLILVGFDEILLLQFH